MFNLLRTFNRQITGALITTLGVMWLSIAIGPCILAATIDGESHQCCQNSKEKAGNRQQLHDQIHCDSCGSMQPVLQQVPEYITGSKRTLSDYQPVITERNHYLLTHSNTIVTRLLVPVYQPLPPPLRYRVLQI